VNVEFSDLRSLYRAAEREERSTRADKRAVRTAILSTGIASSVLHTPTASAKLISLVPGGAKVLTIGQVMVLAGVGTVMGSGLALVGAATAPPATMAKAAPTAPTPVLRAPARPAATEPTQVRAEPPTLAEIRSEPVPVTQPSVVSIATNKRVPSVPGANRLPTPVRTAQPASSPMLSAAPVVTLAPAQSIALPPPSLIDESRELAAVQAALGGKDSTRALQLLDAQDQAYSAGSLSQERAAARVIAFCIAGQANKAQVAKGRFINTYPGSPWLRRINAACAK